MSCAVRSEARRILILSGPIIITQLAQMALGVVDVFMLGRVSTEAQSAATLGHVWIWGTYVVGLGLIIGMDPIATQAFGRRDREGLTNVVTQAVCFSLVVSVPLTALWFLTDRVLILLGQDPHFAELAHDYVIFQAFGTPPLLVATALRQYLQAQGIVRPIMWLSILTVVLNVLFNWILIFGKIGFPELGLLGAAIATGWTRVCLFLFIAYVVIRRLRRAKENRPILPAAADFASYRRILAFGIPVALQFSAEVWAFQGAGIFAGWIAKTRPETLAAHGIVFSLAGLSFMVPLGISLGTVTRVGNLIGEGRYRRAQTAAWAAFSLALVFATVSALTFGLGGRELAGIFSKELDVIDAAAAILPIAAAFQWFDGVQVIGSGVLRGMGRTRPAAVFNLLGYYVLALPVGFVLAFQFGMGLRGIWLGLAGGLGVVACLLLYWVAKMGPASLRR